MVFIYKAHKYLNYGAYKDHFKGRLWILYVAHIIEWITM